MDTTLEQSRNIPLTGFNSRGQASSWRFYVESAPDGISIHRTNAAAPVVVVYCTDNPSTVELIVDDPFESEFSFEAVIVAENISGSAELIVDIIRRDDVFPGEGGPQAE